MTTTPLADFLAPYWPEPARLTRDLAAHSTGRPGIQLISELARQCDGGEASPQITADGLAMLGQGLGFATVEQFIALAELLQGADPELLMRYLGLRQRPALAMAEYANAHEVTPNDLLARGRAHFVMADDVRSDYWSGRFQPHYDDKRYRLLSPEACAEILARAPMPVRGYEAERADCDDFTRCLRGYTSRWGIGNVAMGAVDIVMLDAQERITERHTLLVAALTDGRMVLAEPQIREIVPADYAFGGATHNALLEWRF